MKLVKPSGNTLQEAAIVTGGAGAGAALSRVAVGAIFKPKAGDDEATKKKNQNTLLAMRAGLAVVGIVAYAAVSGKDTGATAAKASFAGWSAIQVIDALRDRMASKGITAATATSQTDKLAADAVGLGCNCGVPALGMGMVIPTYDYEAREYAPVTLPALRGYEEQPARANGPFAA